MCLAWFACAMSASRSVVRAEVESPLFSSLIQARPVVERQVRRSRLTDHPPQPTDGPIEPRRFTRMDKWDYLMQNRDARLVNAIDDSPAAWWDTARKRKT